MSTYKLTYFNLRGLAEHARLIFAAAGVHYEDCRVQRDDWPTEFKEKCPFGQMPVLEVDGKMLAQHKTIARYLANEFHLTGKDNWEQAQTDMLVDELRDLNIAMRFYFYEKDPETKETLSKTFRDETAPKRLANLENILEKNNGGQGFLVGDSLTWADLALANSNDWLRLVCPDPFGNFPLLAGLIKRVRESPKVAEWISKRPDTPI